LKKVHKILPRVTDPFYFQAKNGIKGSLYAGKYGIQAKEYDH